MPANPFFNAHHSPVGAFASFTLGLPGQKGGLGLELGRPAEQNVYIGAESGDGTRFDALPFFAAAADERARYDVEQRAAAAKRAAVLPFPRESIRRDFRLGTDTWTAGDLTFRILSPVRGVPDPARGDSEELKQVVLPAVLAELTLDNRAGTRPRRLFFGFQGNDAYSSMRNLADTAAGRFAGVAQGTHTGIACADPDVVTGQGFGMEDVLAPAVPENRVHGLGAVAGLVAAVPAGAARTLRFAVCFYRGGIVTAGLPCSYWYTRYYRSLEEVAAFALEHFDLYAGWAAEADALLAGARLSGDQAFQFAHAIRSYYGSTEFLQTARGRKPFWVVNEGEYRMMNTFDLTADHLFFEMRLNPWTVRNELDWFADRFRYSDSVHFPGGANEHPGGVSFTHDMGVANSISRPGWSSYEQQGLDGCFSHMTHEQLVNWVLCATVYLAQAGDDAWRKKRLPLFRKCLTSLVNRDHPDPRRRTGVMKLDSSRTLHGAEITTYDSLDTSLGQARNNLYMAVKTWAAYIGLERLFGQAGLAAPARTAGRQARCCATAIGGAITERGYIPAVMGEGNDSKIIPAVEGLVFPLFSGCPEAVSLDGPYSGFVRTLKRHLETVLVPGVCLFPDGGWKLSSTSDNSWLSKIYLCQFVARKVLGLPWDERGRAADAAHVAWLTHPELSYWSWSDQIIAGKITGSKYYPRGVTAILWLLE